VTERVAIVTGAARGIGAAAAAFFRSEEASYVNGQVLYVAGGPKA
jgi:NAD(P)-dependent dehydrogenase (short-subunit alcohol dehydrogenase family)